MERVIAYIDGFNLYYGLRSQQMRRFYWLNLQALACDFLRPGQSLVATRYFTSIVTEPEDKRLRQTAFIDALLTLDDLTVTYGKFLCNTVTCRNCGHSYERYNEKMTDVNIAVQMLSDAYRNEFDVAFLVSADSDLVPPVREVRQLLNKRVIAIYPPGRGSGDLDRAVNGHLHITDTALARCQFPDEVIAAKGVVLQRPDRWR